jgi:hypothetical protein
MRALKGDKKRDGDMQRRVTRFGSKSEERRGCWLKNILHPPGFIVIGLVFLDSFLVARPVLLG